MSSAGAVPRAAMARATLPRPTKLTLPRVTLVFMGGLSICRTTSTRMTTRSRKRKGRSAPTVRLGRNAQPGEIGIPSAGQVPTESDSLVRRARSIRNQALAGSESVARDGRRHCSPAMKPIDSLAVTVSSRRSGRRRCDRSRDVGTARSPPYVTSVRPHRTEARTSPD
jgi:hypothetical protein